MRLLRFSLVWAFTLCCFALVSAEASTSVWTGQNSATKQAEAGEDESERIIRRHGFDRSAARKTTTIKLPSRGDRSENAESGVNTSRKETGKDYGYPPKVSEAADDPLTKFGPPPRRYDLVPEAAAPQDVKEKADRPRSGRVGVGSSNRKSGTVITLPPKKERAETKRREPAALKKEDSYGYNPERAIEDKSVVTEETEKKTVRSGRDNKKRRVTTIALPAKDAAASQGRAIEEADDKDSKIRDKRSSRSRKTAVSAPPPRAENAPALSEDEKTADKAGGRNSRKSAKSGGEAGNTNTASLAPQDVPASPAPLAYNSADDMKRAYQAFDYAYENSLGKSRKELSDLWGFPLQRMGGDENEVVYGFRQRGVLAEDPAASSKKKQQATHHYTSGDARPGQAPAGRNFACLVILWVDKGGRGVVVDGDAVGDCFLVEALPQKPLHFER